MAQAHPFFRHRMSSMKRRMFTPVCHQGPLPADDIKRRRFLQASSAAGLGCLLASPANAFPGLVDLMGQPLSRSVANPAAGAPTIDTIRALLLASLAKTSPVVGGFFAALGDFFIPTAGEKPETLWQRYTDAKIEEAVINLVKADMAGLSDVARLYRDAVRDGDKDTIKTQSIAARTVFAQRLPQFQMSGHEIALLPYFTLAATLEMTLLRDMALTGKEIGLSDDNVESVKEDLTQRIKRYGDYLVEPMKKAVAKAIDDNPHSNDPAGRNQPLTAVLSLHKQMSLDVIDVFSTWKAFDARKYPNGARIVLDRQVFSPIIGWWERDSKPPQGIPKSWRFAPPDIRSVEFWVRTQWRTEWMYGFKVTYADSTELTTGEMSGTRTLLDMSDRYATNVAGHSGSAIGGMKLRTHPDNRLHQVGPDPYESQRVITAFAPRGHRLSSLRSIGKGVNSGEGAVSGFVAGFQLLDKEAAPDSTDLLMQLSPDLPPQVMQWLAMQASSSQRIAGTELPSNF
jgi:hypothetical protein